MSDSNGSGQADAMGQYDDQVNEAANTIYEAPRLPEAITFAPTPVPPADQAPVENLNSFFGAMESCTFCDTTDKFDPDLEFAGISCDQWALLSFFAPPGDECTLLRAAAVKYCGCPTPVERTCQVCPHSPDSYNGDQVLMFLEGVTCEHVAELPAVDGEDTCDFVESFSYVCGCPEVVPTCSLCGQDLSTGAPIAMSRPDQILVPGDEEKYDVTCSDWDKLLSLDPRGDPLSLLAVGRSFQRENRVSKTTTSCEASIEEFQDTAGLHLRGLCGCPEAEPLNQCSPCAEGYTLNEEDEDCQQLIFMAPYVTTKDKCDYMQQSGVHFGCCVTITESPSSRPSVSPTFTSSTNPTASPTKNFPPHSKAQNAEEDEALAAAQPTYPDMEDVQFPGDDTLMPSSEDTSKKDSHSSSASLHSSLGFRASAALLLLCLL